MITRTARDDSEHASYLGYPLEITCTRVRAFTPAGALLADVGSIGAARILVRAHRRDRRENAA